MVSREYVVVTTMALAFAVAAYEYGKSSAGTEQVYEQGCGLQHNCNWYDKMFLHPKNERAASLPYQPSERDAGLVSNDM